MPQKIAWPCPSYTINAQGFKRSRTTRSFRACAVPEQVITILFRAIFSINPSMLNSSPCHGSPPGDGRSPRNCLIPFGSAHSGRPRAAWSGACQHGWSRVENSRILAARSARCAVPRRQSHAGRPVRGAADEESRRSHGGRHARPIASGSSVARRNRRRDSRCAAADGRARLWMHDVSDQRSAHADDSRHSRRSTRGVSAAASACDCPVSTQSLEPIQRDHDRHGSLRRFTIFDQHESSVRCHIECTSVQRLRGSMRKQTPWLPD